MYVCVFSIVFIYECMYYEYKVAKIFHNDCGSLVMTCFGYSLNKKIYKFYICYPIIIVVC